LARIFTAEETEERRETAVAKLARSSAPLGVLGGKESVMGADKWTSVTMA
jgi:hypothetical protein